MESTFGKGTRGVYDDSVEGGRIFLERDSSPRHGDP